MACPFDFNAHAGRGEVFGITRVSRRPELVGLGFYGLAGALVATTGTQVAMWGIGPLVSFSILAIHSDRVQRRGGELSQEKEHNEDYITERFYKLAVKSSIPKVKVEKRIACGKVDNTRQKGSTLSWRPYGSTAKAWNVARALAGWGEI
eukprot:g33118.t1